MASKIFISYQRDDSADVCARIYDWLTYRLPPENVYKDVESVPFGADFMQHVGAYIKQSSVMLLVIGQKWLTPGQGVSKYVQMEIELASHYRVKIIPVLVHEATMPPAAALPLSIQAIVGLNANSVHALDPYFRTDMERLAPDLGIGKAAPSRGGSYWGITHPRYLLLSLLALATCIGLVMFLITLLSVINSGAFNQPGNQVNVVTYSRWSYLSVVIMLVGGLLTLVLFLALVIGGRHWRWLGGFVLSLVPFLVYAVVIDVYATYHPLTTSSYPELSVPVAMLGYGVPLLTILAFAVFGPTNRAKRVFLWVVALELVLCACWIFWYSVS
jgi:hypothetical protein